MRLIVQFFAISAPQKVCYLLPDGIECRLAFRAAAVAADQLADSLFGNTDSGKPIGNVMTPALTRVRVCRVRLINGYRPVFVFGNNARPHFFQCVASLAAALLKLGNLSSYHGKLFIDVKMLKLSVVLG